MNDDIMSSALNKYLHTDDISTNISHFNNTDTGVTQNGLFF